MKRVALVTAHFPPSNLVGVHRARIWAQHLPEFGWLPTIVTAHWKHYQEPLDWELMRLVPSDVQVIRTNALSVRYAKLIGNMALRAMWWTRRELNNLLVRKEVDFIHIIVPDHYSALLGPLMKKRHGVPYGIDYMDPWVHASPSEKRFMSKAWISCLLSYYLEPWAVSSARLITAVSSPTYDSVIKRNAKLDGKVITAEIPMASPSSDYDALSDTFEPATRLFNPLDGRLHIIYAGSIPNSFHDSTRCFLSALRECIDENVLAKELRIWLVGTGTSRSDSNGGRVKKLIDAFSLSEFVSEHPSRIGYVDVLWHLKAASGVLVLGSTENHYTPSKMYQAIQSGNPVLALVPANGQAAAVLRSSNRGVVVNYPDDRTIVKDAVKQALVSIVSGGYGKKAVPNSDINRNGARAGAQRLADCFDLACEY